MFGILPWKRKKENHANEFRREIDSLYDRFFEPNFLPSSFMFSEGKWDPTLDIIILLFKSVSINLLLHTS